jgi:hypothetical protein
MRIGIIRPCFVVCSCLLAGSSAFRWVDYDVQTVFCGEQLLLAGRSAVRLADWDVQTVFCGEQLPFDSSVGGPMEGLGCSDSVLW